MAGIRILALFLLLFASMACIEQKTNETNQNATSDLSNSTQSYSNLSDNATAAPYFHLNTVPPQRIKNLARGVNVANWFWYPAYSDSAHFEEYMTDTELEWLNARGFTFIRLPVDPKLLYLEGMPGTPNETTLAHINNATARVLAHNLSIVIELHENDWSRLENDAAYDDGLVKLWGAMAKNLSRFDSDKVFFEPVNEPRYYTNPLAWFSLQDRFLSAIRASAPNNTIFATGPIMSSVQGTMLNEPVDDGNIIYTFHFYDPAAFTHQGAGWLPGGFDQIKNLAYPYEEANCGEVAANTTPALAKAAVKQYCADEWNATVVRKKIGVIADWAKEKNVTLLAGEFGAYEVVTPPASRAAWLKDARMTFDENKIGWCVWSYDTGFGIGAKLGEDGEVHADEAAMDALGLGQK